MPITADDNLGSDPQEIRKSVRQALSILRATQRGSIIDRPQLESVAVVTPALTFSTLDLPSQLPAGEEERKRLVREAYNLALGREPDAAGLANYLDHLSRGSLSPVEVVWALRTSAEGAAHCAYIRGLATAMEGSFAALEQTKKPTWPVVASYFDAAIGQTLAELKKLGRVVSDFVLRQQKENELNAKREPNQGQLDRFRGTTIASLVQLRADLESGTTKMRAETNQQLEAATGTLLDRMNLADVKSSHLRDALDRAIAELRAETNGQLASATAEMGGKIDSVLATLGLLQRDFDQSKADQQTEMSRQLAAATEPLKEEMRLMSGASALLRRDLDQSATDLRAETVEQFSSAMSSMDQRFQTHGEKQAIVISSLFSRLEELEKTIANQFFEIDTRIQLSSTELERSVRTSYNQDSLKISNAIASLNDQFGKLSERHDNAISELSVRLAEMKENGEKQINEDKARLDRLQRMLIEQERRLMLLLEAARQSQPGQPDTSFHEVMKTEAGSVLDGYYSDFEDVFRGPREEIKQGLRVYMPTIKEAKAGRSQRPIIDIGCGRGEWLEFLGEQKLISRGVDANRVMVERCRELNLDVTSGDALEYLQALAPGSVGAITGFHIIEHMPFQRLVSLLDASLRALARGGVAIFETPNPRNIFVGLADFYIDPTHIAPVHPEAIQWAAEARGFIRTETFYFDQRRTRLIPSNDYDFTTLDAALQVSRDYVLVGFKA